MSLVQLQSLVVVAQEQNLGRAAKRLSVSQPPLTRRIQSLEAELGLEVFERNPKGMRLRPEGQAIVRQAERVLKEVQILRTLSAKVTKKQERPRPQTLS